MNGIATSDGTQSPITCGYTNFSDVFEVMTYPAGEPHVRLKDSAPERVSVIEVHPRNFNDLGAIFTANRILRHLDPSHTITWYIPYFPFARHDRRNDAHDGFELRLVLDLIAHERLRVVTVDPHSDVSGVLPHVPQKVVVRDLRRQRFLSSETVIAIPDLGAAKKAGTWIGDNRHVQCIKHRDVHTGKLSGFEVLAMRAWGHDTVLDGADCMIVDDICDGGGTFLGLAAELRKCGAKSLTLAVTHGLFTQGFEGLREAFDHIISFGPEAVYNPDNNLTVIPYQNLFQLKEIV